ncbi:MAG TPA: hypothetical protein VK904_06150, partial [Miltoncostaeaceae bacterium]|nr:hypothetical protein [Miltoncostaeaceae bacterium]
MARTIPGRGLPFLGVGVAFGTLAALIALSPLGRRSGAHLNPAVTLMRRSVGRDDLTGYVATQVAWGEAATRPDAALGPAAAAAAVEAGLTCALLVAIFAAVSVERLTRWTPARGLAPAIIEATTRPSGPTWPGPASARRPRRCWCAA